MTKELLLKHIEGNTTNQENCMVEQWLAKSAENRRYYAELKNLLVMETMPHTKASAEELYNFHTRMEQKQEQSFRSVLELILLMDSALRSQDASNRAS